MKIDNSLPEPLHDFRNVLAIVWKKLLLPSPTPLQYDIAQYLQHGPRRKVIKAFRGIGKSWITSAYAVFVLLHDPDENILVVSASKDRADQFSTFAKRLIREVPIFQHLQAQKHQRSSNISFDVGPARPSHSPSVKSVGVLGQLTGSRAGVIIADDVEVPNNSETQHKRLQLAERVKEFDAIIKPEGSINYLGTPQSIQSLYQLLPGRGYSTRTWPGRSPTPQAVEDYSGSLAPYVQDKLDSGELSPGEPTDPDMFGDEDLVERELSYGKSGFQLQFMLSTVLSDANRYPLKLSDLVVCDVHPDYGLTRIIHTTSPDYKLPDLPNVGLQGDHFHRPLTFGKDKDGNPILVEYPIKVMSIDPSGRGQDHTGYAIGAHLDGCIHVMKAGGMLGGFNEGTLKELARLAKDYGVRLIKVESNFGDGMFEALLVPALREAFEGHSIPTIESVRQHVQKEKRICDTLEPVMNAHKLIIDPKVITDDYSFIKQLPGDRFQEYSLMYQMTRMTRERGTLVHDDAIDALSILVGHFSEKMKVDVKEAEHARLEALQMQEYEKYRQAYFKTHNTPFQPKAHKWVEP